MELRWGQARPHLPEQLKIVHLLEQLNFFLIKLDVLSEHFPVFNNFI